MTLAKAQTILSAIIAAGYQAYAHPVNGDLTNWIVRAATLTNSAFDVDVQAAAQLATNQGVVGKISSIEYS